MYNHGPIPIPNGMGGLKVVIENIKTIYLMQIHVMSVEAEYIMITCSNWCAFANLSDNRD